MKYCTKCGNQMEDNAAFCSRCGTKAADHNRSSISYQKLDLDIAKILSIISYIGILWIIGLVLETEKKNPYVRFHVGQGMILTIVSAILAAVAGMSSLFLNILFWPIGIVFSSGISFIIGGAVICLVVLGIVNAAKGETKPLPIIGELAFYK